MGRPVFLPSDRQVLTGLSLSIYNIVWAISHLCGKDSVWSRTKALGSRVRGCVSSSSTVLSTHQGHCWDSLEAE